MKSFGKYLTWFLFGLAVLGGVGTLWGMLGNSEAKEEVFVQDNSDESFALLFAEKYLTVQAGETASDRQAKLDKYLDTENFQWEEPTVSQKPIRLDVSNVVRENNMSIVTILATVAVTNPSAQTESETVEASEETEATENANKSEKDAVQINELRKAIKSEGGSTYDFSLVVSLIKNENGEWLLYSEPSKQEVVFHKVHKKNFDFPKATENVSAISSPFIKTFIEKYYSVSTQSEIASFLDKEAEIMPKGNILDLKQVNKVDVYSLSEDGEESQNFFAHVSVTVKDSQTGIISTESLRVYFNSTKDETFLITGLYPY